MELDTTYLSGPDGVNANYFYEMYGVGVSSKVKASIFLELFSFYKYELSLKFVPFNIIPYQ